MPIYAYRCATCGHAQDVLQKMSDNVLTVCPACSAATYEKQVTAAGFQLKGSGWYVTDFRGGNTPAASKEGKDGADGKDGAVVQPGDKQAAGGDAAATTAPATGTPAAPAPTVTPAPSPSPAPAAAPPASSGS